MNTRIYTFRDKLTSLIADEAKNLAMIRELANTVNQLRAKSSFRLSLLHQLNEEYQQIKQDESKE